MRRKKQFGKQIKIRTYQFTAIAGAMFFYLFVYRRFLHPTSITNSVVYNQAISFVKQNKKCADVLGTNFEIMTCNGKMYPFKSDLKFQVVVFGPDAKGKLNVNASFDKPS